MRRLPIFATVVVLGLTAVGCSGQTPKTGGSDSLAEPTELPVQMPTNTKAVTQTPAPTETVSPAQGDIAPGKPVEFSGEGNDIIDLEGYDWPDGAYAHVVYKGSDEFDVARYNEDGEELGLITWITTKGPFDGLRMLDMGSILETDVKTTRMGITATGAWTVTIYPNDPKYATKFTVPGSYESSGDNVYFLTTGPDIATITFKAASDWGENIQVTACTAESCEMLVNELNIKYDGKVVLPKGTFILATLGNGEWKIDITAR